MVNNKKPSDFHDQIKDLVGIGLTNPEIATEIGLTRPQVAAYVQKFLGGNENYLKRRAKHKHLHEKILKLRLKMSDEEIRDKLCLSEGEMKSCMTCAYRREDLKHLRKDKRRRDSWSSDELRFLLKWSGIISQEEINKYLKRGKNRIVIKEKLQQLGLCSKNINGLTHSKFRALFGCDPFYFLQTSAGSPASKFSELANWIIVPWCHIEEMLNDGVIDHTESLKIYVSAMAIFQRWVHGDDYWKSLTSVPVFNKASIK